MNVAPTAQWSADEAHANFLRCCGSERWARAMVAEAPYPSEERLLDVANAAFDAMAEIDWLEAFRAHPKIGDLASMKKKFASTANWSAGEQGAMSEAAEELLTELAAANAEYETKNGFIFIVCATGKSPREMLTRLRERLAHTRDEELRIAAGEQRKITHIRLEKLLP